MRLLFYVLSKTEKLDDILAAFARGNIGGATVLESMGMARLLSHNHCEDEIPFLGSLRKFLSPEREKGNLIFAVIHDDQLEEAINIIESVVGDLSAKDNGVVFSLPIDFTKGIN
ncbi:hypothetical protein JYG23_09215 [Sedimentibacter sp. zth1]|uniref:hypothetical protein n=1 Tax=Sedimentibacter sp. zth1 TaxID=2816908 RepID=UPI001A914DAB|nr:hypothetical protein [Sedimentibacter sp. zth1]QSX04879.1 hypothetical protein JYG23_09215 [Sedimentibacter sp. zth1]